MMQRNTQAHPPSETQQLEDARIAMEQAIVRIGDLERQVDSYRRKYNQLFDAARIVVGRMEKDDNKVTPDTAAALRELSRCVSSTSVAHEPAQSEETQL
jgi:hypothetical protein